MVIWDSPRRRVVLHGLLWSGLIQKKYHQTYRVQQRAEQSQDGLLILAGADIGDGLDALHGQCI